MNRKTILETGLALTTGDRNKAYGSPFDNLSNIAVMWNAYLTAKYRGQVVDELQFQLTTVDVAHLNLLQKMARTMLGDASRAADTYIDMAVYAAIAGECADEEVRLAE